MAWHEWMEKTEKVVKMCGYSRSMFLIINWFWLFREFFHEVVSVRLCLCSKTGTPIELFIKEITNFLFVFISKHRSNNNPYLQMQKYRSLFISFAGTHKLRVSRGALNRFNSFNVKCVLKDSINWINNAANTKPNVRKSMGRKQGIYNYFMWNQFRNSFCLDQINHIVCMEYW